MTGVRTGRNDGITRLDDFLPDSIAGSHSIASVERSGPGSALADGGV
jgi:hypothetical protein